MVSRTAKPAPEATPSNSPSAGCRFCRNTRRAAAGTRSLAASSISPTPAMCRTPRACKVLYSSDPAVTTPMTPPSNAVPATAAPWTPKTRRRSKMNTTNAAGTTVAPSRMSAGRRFGLRVVSTTSRTSSYSPIPRRGRPPTPIGGAVAATRPSAVRRRAPVPYRPPLCGRRGTPAGRTGFRPTAEGSPSRRAPSPRSAPPRGSASGNPQVGADRNSLITDVESRPSPERREEAGPHLGRPCRRPRAHRAVIAVTIELVGRLTDGGRRGFPAQARAPILGRRPADPRPGSITRDPPRPRCSLGCGAGRGRGRERDRYGRRPARFHQPVDRGRGLAGRPGVPRTGTPRHGRRAPGRGACRRSRSDPAHAAGGLAAHVPGRFRADAAAVHRPRAGIHAHRGGFGDEHPRVLAAGERRLDGDRCRRRVRLAGDPGPPDRLPSRALQRLQPPGDLRRPAERPRRRADLGPRAARPHPFRAGHRNLHRGDAAGPLRGMGALGRRRHREPPDLPAADLLPLAPRAVVLGDRPARCARLGRAVPGALAGGRPPHPRPPVPAQRVHLLHPDRAGPRRPGFRRGRPGSGQHAGLRGLPGRRRPTQERRIPHRTRAAGGLAGLRRLAGELRTGRVRRRLGGLGPAGAVVGTAAGPDGARPTAPPA